MNQRDISKLDKFPQLTLVTGNVGSGMSLFMAPHTELYTKGWDGGFGGIKKAIGREFLGSKPYGS